MKEFKEIPKYPKYSISEDGRIYSSYSNRELKTHKFTNGRAYASFSVNGMVVKELISRLILHTYKDMDLDDKSVQADHRDNDKTNDTLGNLQILTVDEHINKSVQEIGHERHECNTCLDCAKEVSYRVERCKDCHTKNVSKNTEITADQIKYWVCKYSWVRAGKELGLSDNGLRKRYKSLTGKDPKNIKRE